MKHRTSIKTRVTGWYVFFLILIVCLLFTGLVTSSNRTVQNGIKDNLQSLVEYSIKDVQISDGQLHIDRDMVNYKDGISIIVYKENNFIVTGALPDGIQENIPFIDGTVRTVEDHGNKFYVYDVLINDPDYQDVWVRGITSADFEENDPALAMLSRAFLILLPLLTIIAGIGGYLITRRAFRPVAQITDTARSIQAGGDLSKRIGLPAYRNNKDEVYNLAITVDDMLERLDESFKTEKQFSDDASHELRTPLAVIMAQCEYAMNDERSPEETQEALEVIYGESRRMSDLINRLLMMARADRGALPVSYELINVSELTEMITASHELQAEERSITITTEIEPDIMAEVDESMFIRIWDNLLSNSIKYSKDNGGTIAITLAAADGRLYGRIRDDGIGIAPENLSKIWQRFYQVDPSRNDSGSAGLGLSIVDLIISQHGGTITADSKPGEWTEIKFSLPLNRADNKIASHESETLPK